MAIFLGVSAAPERILLSKISYAPVQHSSPPESFIVAIVWALSGHYETSRSPIDSSIGGGFEKFMWGSEDDQLCGDDNSGYRGLTWHILDKCYKEVELCTFFSIESLHILCFAQGRYTTTSCKREHWNGRSQKII